MTTIPCVSIFKCSVIIYAFLRWYIYKSQFYFYVFCRGIKQNEKNYKNYLILQYEKNNNNMIMRIQKNAVKRGLKNEKKQNKIKTAKI